jgi:hypothetical protein
MTMKRIVLPLAMAFVFAVAVSAQDVKKEAPEAPKKECCEKGKSDKKEGCCAEKKDAKTSTCCEKSTGKEKPRK